MTRDQARSDDQYFELQIETSPEAADMLAAELAPLLGGVELRDQDTYLSAPQGRTIVIAHCARPALDEVLSAVDTALDLMRAGGVHVDPVVIRQREAHEDEWRDVWKQYFRATRIGRRFIVRPSWDPGVIATDDEVIDLDPGRAFGTGAHPSTRLCLALAERVYDQRAEVGVGRFLDLGCGSGILAIAASKLWPRAQGLAADVDSEATDCAAENLARNHVTTVQTKVGTLGPEDGRFDLILANIQMDVLEQLAPDLAASVAPSGRLILSGLLVEQGDATVACFARAGFTLLDRLDEGEWTGLLLSPLSPSP